jgi:hypothetical protein
MERMPDSMIDIDIYVEDEKLFFRRFFCAFGPGLEGFRKGFRPYLSVDSTTLNGRWNGHLPSATCYFRNWKIGEKLTGKILPSVISMLNART